MVLWAALLLSGCGGSDGSSGGTAVPGPTGANVLAVAIDPSSPVCDLINLLCGSVTVCQPGTSLCQTISDVIIDTGSQGLRLFASALGISLPPQTSGGAPIGECAFFGSETLWGPVQVADVTLAGEPAVQVPVQVINATFAGQYSATGQPAGNVCGAGPVESSPSQAGYNGILGIGLFRADGQFYYACTGTACTPVAVPPAGQVQNPVALLPVDNNGVVVTLPAVAAAGVPSIRGSVILGIGTQSNNQPTGVTVYPADACGTFLTTYKGTTFTSGLNCSQGGAFLDTGSNALFFPDAAIPVCSALPFFHCPATPLGLSAVNAGALGSPSGAVNFQIANAASLQATGNAVFNNLGGPVSGFFDWGLPFFLGRTVYLGISGQNSVLGRGPFWAY